MFCYKCGCELNQTDRCPNCGTDVGMYKKILYTSNYLYNDGLEKAQVRDLSGAILSLKQALWYNKDNLNARNLLGLIYYEVGETVAALAEWVIAKNINDERLHEKENAAERYLNEVQSNRQLMDNLNTSIARYNHALDCCRAGNTDVAILQLKKVLSLNPHYLRARQLLSLLYLNSRQWQRAQRELEKCSRLDVSNTTTLRYMKEAEEQLAKERGEDENKRRQNRRRTVPAPSAEPDGEQVIKYTNSDHETIIQPVGSRIPGVDGFAFPVWILGGVIGAILGAAVMAFLVMPARIQQVRSQGAEEVRTVSAQIDSKELEIRDLQGQIENLNAEQERLNTELDQALANASTDGGKANNLFYTAACYINNPEDTATSTSVFRALRPDTAKYDASEQFGALYDALYQRLRSAMLDKIAYSGIAAYEAALPDYQKAISELEEANLYEDPEAYSLTYVKRLFYLGDSYLQLYLNADAATRENMTDNLTKAREYFDRIVNEFSDSEYLVQTQARLQTMNGL